LQGVFYTYCQYSQPGIYKEALSSGERDDEFRPYILRVDIFVEIENDLSWGDRLAAVTGMTYRSRGGIVSRGPPRGGTILAQPVLPNTLMIKMERRRKNNGLCWIFML